jgi:hypothetical protein
MDNDSAAGVDRPAIIMPDHISQWLPLQQGQQPTHVNCIKRLLMVCMWSPETAPKNEMMSCQDDIQMTHMNNASSRTCCSYAKVPSPSTLTKPSWSKPTISKHLPEQQQDKQRQYSATRAGRDHINHPPCTPGPGQYWTYWTIPAAAAAAVKSSNLIASSS